MSFAILLFAFHHSEPILSLDTNGSVGTIVLVYMEKIRQVNPNN